MASPERVLTSRGKLKSTHTVNECSPSIGLTSSDTEIFAQLIGEPSNPSISCAAGSPVKTLASPEKALDSPANAADSGSSTPKRSKSSSRATSSSKMSAPFALADWIECSGRSLRSGMMRNGIVYPLAPLVPLTGVIGSGLLPTPKATEHKGGHSSKGGPSLGMMATHNLWPTPVAQEGGQGVNPTARGRKSHIEALKWPTPSVCGNYNRKGASATSGDGLATVVGGALNPTWVEWLMGYPQNWTSLED